MAKPRFWRTSHQYQMSVSRFCSQNGLQSPAIATVIFSQKGFEQAHPKYAKQFRGIPALSIGLVTPARPILGRFASKPVGLIAFEEEIENVFDPMEREFVLAHEYSHIVKNHCPIKLLGRAASNFVEDYISDMDDSPTRMILQIAWQYGSILASAGFTKDSEIEADIHAMQLIGSKSIALTTVETLAHEFAGGDLTKPTHFILRGKQRIPVLSYQERLDALRNCPSLAI